MAIFKCKMCGGTIEFNPGDTVGVCDSCGTKQTLPRLDNDRKANLYDRANHFRRNNDYDKAMGIYEQILNEDNTDAEAYWSLVLCRYGIEYVEDPASHKRISTVNRAQFTSIFADENYKSALQYADSYQRTIYEAEARAIDEIQKGILAISQKEEPFDVFICYKETDANGRRTQDSVLANDLYHQLTQEGFKVFFSRITLEDKLGTAYEPYIFAALNSAKVMVVLGTKPEYFNAVWVKNEWSRYLALIKNGAKKMLIPAYRDMDPYDLPEEFSHLQAQDMSKLGFMQDLIRGIKKIVKSDEPSPAVKETVVVNGGSTSITPLLKRAFMFLEDGNWTEADNYCEKVLDSDPENGQAYLGKLMAELHVRKKECLKDCIEPFNNNNNYQKAVRFGDNDLPQYIAYINNRNETAEHELKEKAANVAKAILHHISSISTELITKHLQKEIEALETIVADFPETTDRIRDLQTQIRNLSEQIETLNDYKGRLGFFKTKEKKETENRISDTEREIRNLKGKVSDLIAKMRGYHDISEIERNLETKKRKLNSALEKMKNNDSSFSYDEAVKVISSNLKIKEEVFSAYPIIERYIGKGEEIIEFGSYPQDSAGHESLPLVWRILAKEKKRILLISDKIIDCQPYNTPYADVTWETCSLRKWMNDTFLNEAFSPEEQTQILFTNVPADPTETFGYGNVTIDPGNATTDKVFLLSINEANLYFSEGVFETWGFMTDRYYSSVKPRKCAPTTYAKEHGVKTDGLIKTESNEATCMWWLRTPGDSLAKAAVINAGGYVGAAGACVNDADVGVRPALWISLE